MAHARLPRRVGPPRPALIASLAALVCGSGFANPVEREEIDIAGFPIRMDKALLEGGEHADLGEKTRRLLAADLVRIELIVPTKIVDRFKQITVVVDYQHPLKNMQYHPSKQWLENNGYEGNLAKCVHIAKAGIYASTDHYFVQPMALLHEYAHAYHDQVLGYEEERIRHAFARAQLEKKYEKVLHIKGHTTRHYALSNHKEYFAEATEAWFGQNDFYPFVRAELKEHDPRLHGVLEEIWSGN